MEPGVNDKAAVTKVLLAAVASAEGTVRAQDIKAQIALASVSLMALPAYNLGSIFYDPKSHNLMFGVFLIWYLAVVVMFIIPLWPSFAPLKNVRMEGEDVYFPIRGAGVDLAAFARRAYSVDLVELLCKELLSLSEIRNRKNRALRAAICLWLSLVGAVALAVLIKMMRSVA